MVSIVSPTEQRVVSKLATSLGVPNREGSLSYGKLIPAATAQAAPTVGGGTSRTHHDQAGTAMAAVSA